jgi:hypothetical protein
MVHAGWKRQLPALLAARLAFQLVVSPAQARGNRYADTAALFQALGGAIEPVATAATIR